MTSNEDDGVINDIELLPYEEKTSEAEYAIEECEKSLTGDPNTSNQEGENDDEKQGDVVKIDEARKRPAIKIGEYFSVKSFDELQEVLNDYYERSLSRFSVYSRSKDFGRKSAECSLFNHKVTWHDKENPQSSIVSYDLPFDGIPRMTVGDYHLQCQFGSDYSASRKSNMAKKKQELLEEQLREGKDVTIKSRKAKIKTKKCGCPAKISIRQVIRFPEYKIIKHTESRMRTATGKLKKALLNDRESVEMEVLYMGRLPDISEHHFHELLEGREYCKETVHEDILRKIQDLYMQDFSINDIMLACKDFVVNEMFHNQTPPDAKRRRFFPNRKDVRNCLLRIKALCKCSAETEQDIQSFIEQAKKDDENLNMSFIVQNEETEDIATESSDDEFFEPDSNKKSPQKSKKTPKKTSKESIFLFCCQTPKQQRLLKRYGNVVFVVRSNGTSRTVPFQMYNVMVQTNVDYQTVCSMIISRQRKDGIKDGLTMLKDWNTYWRPKYFMVDCNKEMYDAVDEVFPDASYLLNPQSCEDEWMKFVKTPSNELTEHTDEVMAFLKNMAYSFTEDSLSIAAALFEGSDVWHNSSKLRTWFQTTWLHIAKGTKKNLYLAFVGIEEWLVKIVQSMPEAGDFVNEEFSAKKWVFGYRPEDLLIPNHWNVCASECVQKYKQASVVIPKVKTWLETVVKRISTVIPEDEYKEYINRNKELYKTSKQFEVSHPMSDCYQGVPMAMLPHIYGLGQLAQENDFEISDDQLGLFTVENIQKLDNEKQTELLETQVEEKLDHIVPVSDNIIYLNQTDATTMVLEKNDRIESSESDLLQQGEFTVSFGDLCNYPFCTCPYWQMYKLPCVHMFAVFCKIPDWKYDMMSPLYRCANVFQFDYSCIEQITTAVDFGCQTSVSSNSVEIQKNWDDIFIDISAISVDTNLLKQCNDLLQHFDKLSFLFNEKVLHKTMRRQLKVLRDSIQSVINKEKIDSPSMKKLIVPSFNISNVDLFKVSDPQPVKMGPVIKSVQTSKDNKYSIVKVQHSDNTSGDISHVLETLSKANPCKKFKVVDRAAAKQLLSNISNKGSPSSMKAKNITKVKSLPTSMKNATESFKTLQRNTTTPKTSIRNTTAIPSREERVIVKRNIGPFVGAASIVRNKASVTSPEHDMLDVEKDILISIEVESKETIPAHNKVDFPTDNTPAHNKFDFPTDNKRNITTSSSRLDVSNELRIVPSGIPLPQKVNKKAMTLKRKPPESVSDKVTIMEYLPKLKKVNFDEPTHEKKT